MSYYWFNKQDILQKAKERYSKKKVLYTKQRINKRKVKKSIQKLVTRRKRQNERVSKEGKDINNWLNTKKKRYKI